ncbi:MAG: type IV pilus assembly protein PilM [Actinomycetales bacterium]
MAGRSAIGLDIGTSGVRAAELSFARGGVTLEKFGQKALPEGAVRDGEIVDSAAVTAAISELWSRTGFSQKKVALGVANQRVVVRQIDLPEMAPSDIKKSLPYQVQDYLPMPVEQAVLDFHPTETVELNGVRHMRGLLVAASRDGVMEAIRCVEAAGLKPTSVDLIGFAVLRSMGTIDDPTVRTEAIIDVGARVTNIVIHTAGVPQFVRMLLTGGQDITDAVSERGGLDHFEAEGVKQQIGLGQAGPEWAGVSRALDSSVQSLLDEVRGSLDYFASSNPDNVVQRIVLSGGGSRLIGFGERLANVSRLPVLMGNPTRSLQIGDTGLSDDQLATVQPLAAVPVGLALGAA